MPSSKVIVDGHQPDLKLQSRKPPCAECKRLKLKCDRAIPCASCVRRGCQETCPNGTYLPTGRGNRAVPTEASRLKRTIDQMQERIDELERTTTALSGYHLNHCPYLGISLKRVNPEIDQLADTLGALSIDEMGTGQYFGRTAGTEVLLSMEGTTLRDAPPANTFTHAIDAFSNHRPSWDPFRACVMLCIALPTRARATQLASIYFRNSCWSGSPILPSELDELITQVYTGPKLLPTCSAHQLAVLYGVFALAAVVDLDLPRYNVESLNFFDLARAALAVVSVFDYPETATVQALVLVSLFLSHGGPRFSMDGAWHMISMASHISQKLGLHSNRGADEFTHKELQRRRFLFWEIYSIETMQGVALGRPTSIYLANISCPFPDEVDEELGAGSCYRRRWELIKQAAAPIAEMYLTAQLPEYAVIVDLDQRIRKFMHSSPECTTPVLDPSDDSPAAYVRSRIVTHSCGILLLAIHNTHFVQSLRDNPEEPYYTPHASSFLSAMRNASDIICAHIQNFQKHEELFLRWWAVWTSLFNATIIVGAVAAKCSQNNIGSGALLAFFVALDLFERGAATSFRARGALPFLHRLRNKVLAAYTHHLDPYLSLSPGVEGSEQDTEALLDVLAGRTRVVAQKIVSGRCQLQDPFSVPAPILGLHAHSYSEPIPLVSQESESTAPAVEFTGIDLAFVEHGSSSHGLDESRVFDFGFAVNEVERNEVTDFGISPFFQEPSWDVFLESL